MENNNFFIEIDSAQAYEMGQNISGDVYLQKKYGDRIIAVLSDGFGSGVKANVVASVISSMLVNSLASDENYLRVAKAAIETFARGNKKNSYKQATFTIVDVRDDGMVNVVEFENPSTIFLRNNELFIPPKVEHIVPLNNGSELKLTTFTYEPQVEDRILFFSDGITQSGLGTKRLPEGWTEDKILKMVEGLISDNPKISAAELSRKVVSTAEINDLFSVKNDMSCASVYFREPRSILMCTGAPFHADKDAFLAQLVDEYKGEVIISGGTTSQIISRELGRDVNVVMKRDPSGLPPVSMMDGASLVTEGVLTLGKVRLLLETAQTTHITGRGTDARIVKMLLDHDIIEFYVGTSVNSLHQDPNLPIELELRRNVIKDISRLLETKFFKQTIVKYI